MGKHAEPAADAAKPDDRRISRTQLFAIWFTQLVQGIQVTLPYTIAVYMVREYEVAAGRSVDSTADQKRISSLTGLLASYFQGAGIFSCYLLGLLSDRVGRKPVLVLGNIACTLCVLFFGLANNYLAASLARFLGGLLNGVIGALKTMIGESAGPVGQAQALGYLSLAWGMGTVAGPAMGGLLSEPCTRFWSGFPLCSHGQLLQRKPYLLPCLAATAIAASATLVSVVLVEETLPRKAAARARRRRAPAALGGKVRYEAVAGDESGDDESGSDGGGAELELVEVAAASARGSKDGCAGAAGADVHCVATPAAGSAAGVQHGVPRTMGGAACSGTAGADVRCVAAPAADSAAGMHHRGPHAAGIGARGADSGWEGGWKGGGSDVFDGGGWGDGGLDSGDEERGLLVRGVGDEGEHRGGGDGGVAWYRQPQVLLSLAGYGLIACLYSFLDEVLPLFASAPVSEGGLGWSSDMLALPLSAGGVVLMAYALAGYPRVQRALGAVACCRLGLLMTLAAALLPPCASLVGGAVVAEQALMFAGTAMKSVAGCSAFTACMVIVNLSAPRAAMGSVNGCGQTVAALVRALGPAGAGLLWSASLTLPLPGHQFMPFVVVAAAALATQFLYVVVRPVPAT